VVETIPRMLVLQHVACEPPAAYEDVLNERGIALDRVVLDENTMLPDWRPYLGVIVMGGPMGANDVEQYPWLRAETQLIAAAVAAGKPYWGVCLGAQLLAAALGAAVYPGARPEVGMGEVSLTHAAATDPVFATLVDPIPVFQWHGDTFDLPAGAQLLASSANYPHQAFRYKGAYGIQFHVEVSADLAAQWLAIPAYAADLEQARGPGSAAAVFADLTDQVAATTTVARTMFNGWLDTALTPAMPTS